MHSIVEGRDFALKGGKPGFITPSGWIPIDTKSFNKQELDRLTADYSRRRGSAQIKKDIETHKAEKAKQDAARKARSTPQQPTPSTTTPAPTTTRTRTPEAPTTRREPTPPAFKPVAQTGDKAKDTAVWAARFPKLAAKVTPTGTQQGTGQSTMAKQAAELRSMQKASQERQAAQSGPMYSSPDVKSKMSTRTKRLLGVSEQYDAFDLVLDYLFSEGHVDTLDEALYVMMEMDAETIVDIVEGDPSFQIKRSTGAGALTPSAAAQLGPKAVELQKKKAAGVDLPNLKQSPSSMAQEV
jgi:hypothetical protein